MDARQILDSSRKRQNQFPSCCGAQRGVRAVSLYTLCKRCASVQITWARAATRHCTMYRSFRSLNVVTMFLMVRVRGSFPFWCLTHTSTAAACNARRARAHTETNTHRPHTAAESTNNAAEKRINFSLLNEVLSVAEEITTDSMDTKKKKERKK